MIEKKNCCRVGVLSIVLTMVGMGGLNASETGPPSGLVVHTNAGDVTLSLDDGAPFHRTSHEVIHERVIDVPGSTIRIALWEEVLATPAGQVVPYYAISLDGQSMATVRRTSYELKLRHGDFDPGSRVPPVEASLAADETSNLYIVQFVTQPLEECRTAIRSLGGMVHHFLANHAHIVEMSASVREKVEALPFVRWVGSYHPAYRLEEALLEGLRQGGAGLEVQRYHIQAVRPGLKQKTLLADRIRAIGGKTEPLTSDRFLVDAILTPGQLLDVVRMNEVLFIDRWLPPRTYMNNVRIDGGADHIETAGGYTGDGVRGEVMDSGLLTSHQAWANPPIIHSGNSSSTWHGTSVYGINFGDGTGDAQGRGLLPDGQGLFCAYDAFEDRYEHTLELIEDPYYAVYQTHSWGSCCTTQYGTEAELMDEMIFDSDLIILQAQANEGSTNSDVSAWAKNVVSVGGIQHYDTLTRADDQWDFAGSIGPAADGRVKPDLSYWYDYIKTTSDSGGYTSSFGGTSAATPETAGHFGLFFQMWADGIFGNEVDPGGTVFENRAHSATAKAMLVNTATQYAFSGTGHDLTRVHQGWGTADVGNLYDRREKISVIDETELLGNLESVEYTVYVEPAEPALRATMVYTDPPGTTSSSQHRINDLTLKVTSPSEVVYWGNHGLLEGNWSIPGGVPNMIDTVENVFIENPEPGIWYVEIIASEVNQDSHVETPELDADFALVVGGGILSTCTSAGRITLDRDKYACTSEATIRVVDCDLNASNDVVETVTVTIESDSEPSGESVLLTETAAQTADFRGTINLRTVDGAGVLLIGEGDVVTTTYNDADDGTGSPAVVQDTAVVDCTAPIISNVQTTNIGPRSATVTFDTNEPAKGVVRYGLSCTALTESATAVGFNTTHTINLTGLDDSSTYFYAVDAEDEATNTSTNDNGGVCYTFSTPDVPDFFTEQLQTGFDLEGLSLIFMPIGSNDFYFGCVQSITELPTDPTGGTTLSFLPTMDDGWATCPLTGGAQVSLYGTTYGDFYVGSNGYITFGGGDSDYTESLDGHFSMPRISGLFDDLNPGAGGSVSWKQLANRAVVTWQNVPEWNTSNSNTFQIEMYFDETLVISYLSIDAGDGIAGLSAGTGLDPDFFQTDLSDMGECNGLVVVPWPENSLSQSCIDDDDCEFEAKCINAVCYAPKQRYISIARNPGQAMDTARRVRLDTGELIGWVGAPYYVPPTSQHSGLWLADVVSSPQYESQWPEVVHVMGCAIAHASLCDVSHAHCEPDACPDGETCEHHSYHVQAIRLGDEVGNEGNYSDALVLHTPSTWGDTIADCTGNQCAPPDGVVGLDDIMAAIQFYQGVSTVPITWLDIDPSSGGHTPDQNVGIGDILACIGGYQGMGYPGDGPLNCP